MTPPTLVKCRVDNTILFSCFLPHIFLSVVTKVWINALFFVVYTQNTIDHTEYGLVVFV